MPREATASVAALIQGAVGELAARARSAEGLGLRRWSAELPGEVSPADWGVRVALHPRMVFESRDGTGQYAAAGAVITFSSADAIQAAEQALAHCPRGAAFYGAARFDPERRAAAPWESFSHTFFFLPRWELVRCGRSAWLSLIARPGEQVPLPRGDGECAAFVPEVFAGPQPCWEAWQGQVNQILREIRSGRLSKAVLARVTRFHRSRGLPLAWLAEPPGASFRFFLEPDPPSGIFLGLSPELLYRRLGRQIFSEAVAGTRSAGPGALELEKSAKEREEFGFVAEALRQGLAALCESWTAKEAPEILEAGPLAHLRQAFEGTLRPGVGDAALLKTLHPTPATCGAPREAACALLRELEPFDRGFYAGPVGRLSREEAEFAVGIRSAMLRGSEMWVWSGAGIVAGSVPALEWEEVERKAWRLCRGQ